MMGPVQIVIPGLAGPLPGKLPGVGQYFRWSSATADVPGATISRACSLIGMCMLHVPAFQAEWAKTTNILAFGDAVFDLLLEGGARVGGDNASIKALVSEEVRIIGLMEQKVAPFANAPALAAFSPAQTETPTSP
jgi:hypothetical protein